MTSRLYKFWQSSSFTFIWRDLSWYQKARLYVPGGVWPGLVDFVLVSWLVCQGQTLTDAGSWNIPPRDIASQHESNLSHINTKFSDQGRPFRVDPTQVSLYKRALTLFTVAMSSFYCLTWNVIWYWIPSSMLILFNMISTLSTYIGNKACWHVNTMMEESSFEWQRFLFTLPKHKSH